MADLGSHLGWVEKVWWTCRFLDATVTQSVKYKIRTPKWL